MVVQKTYDELVMKVHFLETCQQMSKHMLLLNLMPCLCIMFYHHMIVLVRNCSSLQGQFLAHAILGTLHKHETIGFERL